MRLFILYFLLNIDIFANLDNFSLSSEKTLYVVDGDSLSLQMRIKGIDTPEIQQQCQKTSNKTIDCGYFSKHYLQNLLQNLPGELLIKPMGFDYYNRVLVRIYKGGVDIGAYMVTHGMAFSYRNAYQKEEESAKVSKRGFWGFHTPPIRPYRWRKINRR